MIEEELDSLFAEAGCRGMVSVLDIDGSGRVEVRAHERAHAASTFKVAVGLELLCQGADGELDLAERVRLDPAERTFGGQGLCLFEDGAEVSLRDLARLMLTISDNTATDAIVRRVTVGRIAARLAALGLHDTQVPSTIREHFDGVARALGHASLGEYRDALAASSEAQAAAMRREFRRVFGQPGLAPFTTAADMARLIRMIWRDEAGPAASCAGLRTMLGQQRFTRKIATGFGAAVTVAAKSGTVPGLTSNDVGAVSFPDGRRYAVAVFVEARDDDDAEADSGVSVEQSERLIGTAARMAVDFLRSGLAL